MKNPVRICLAGVAAITLTGGLRAADPVPQEQVSFSAGAAGNWNLEWAGVERRTYFVQCSHDLVNWTYCPVIRHGVGTQVYEVQPAAAAGFYVRLKYPNEDAIESLEEARNADFDGDGIPNWREIEELAADPFDVASVGPDGDGDGMPDWWETEKGFDAGNPDDAGEDPDDDELSNLEELGARTDPAYFDSDHDLFGDGFETGPAVQLVHSLSFGWQLPRWKDPCYARVKRSTSPNPACSKIAYPLTNQRRHCPGIRKSSC